MKIAVCEDNNIVAEYLEDYLSSLNVQNIEYEIFTSGDDLIHYMEQEKTSFNILFMDIEMPGRNGIDTSAYIRERDKNALIIFITDHQDYVYQVFEVLPFRFLIKPVQQEQLNAVLRDAISQITPQKNCFSSKSVSNNFKSPMMKFYILKEIYERCTLYRLSENGLFTIKFLRCLVTWMRGYFYSPIIPFLLIWNIFAALQKQKSH